MLYRMYLIIVVEGNFVRSVREERLSMQLWLNEGIIGVWCPVVLSNSGHCVLSLQLSFCIE